ncbi:MAG: aminotransferase class I/II-fold pyridoxal phosphate-dependent enzyme [Chloroflexota bacterium]|nr:aminotransferase class I/II-fold pyridoxal phosphate-dependent enzyme [Chloroflexota bacterium]
MPGPLGLGTRSIHAGEAPDPSTGAHGVPMYQNATYAFRSYEQLEAMRAGQAPHFTYAPRGNPTVRCLELKLADLEGAEMALGTASGMAAVAATLLHLLGDGDHLVASADVYEQTRFFLEQDLPQHGASATLVDVGDLRAVEAAMRPETRALYVEPFSNPLLRVADLPALAEIARRRGVPLVVDNTFLSPALLRPLDHGADVVLHSATKYLSGHGQVQGGFVCGRRDLIGQIAEKVLRLGGAMSPFAAWMLLAGIKTLPLRMDRHGKNALRLARLLSAHPAVAEVNYPGLPADPGHAVARRMVGAGDDRFGGMLSFRLAGGCEATGPFLNALRLCTLAVSLGEYSTLIWPFAGTDLIRLSVGIEDAADLEADLAGALGRLPLAAAAD